ncbi:DUF6526 family protein [Shimazuella kribbensis]|uniref:DUF6526 family protein n=1 Tax=Shimazuella kribbensis TaxID=139808 RepID=UPI000490EB1C|nr:DUF6526 family protein [Shimazuella kribbensis]
MQNYKNHAQIVPVFHYFLAPLALLTTLSAIVYWVWSMTNEGPWIPASLILLVALITTIGLFFARLFATKVQDRAIRAEESLRHYILTGKQMDSYLTIKQIVALRFASDEEFPHLCRETIEENLTPKEIKQEIKNWRADHNRV